MCYSSFINSITIKLRSISSLLSLQCVTSTCPTRCLLSLQHVPQRVSYACLSQFSPMYLFLHNFTLSLSQHFQFHSSITKKKKKKNYFLALSLFSFFFLLTKKGSIIFDEWRTNAHPLHGQP